MTIQLSINDKVIETDNGKTILEAALEAGIYIPHLCYHPDLKPVGTCGVCQVELAGQTELTLSCETGVVDGMIVRTETEAIAQSRLQAMEKLLVNHPTECMNCDAYLTCELRSVRQYIGASDVPKAEIKHIAVDDSNPLFTHDFIRCIKCGRCVRACDDLRNVGILQFLGDGDEKRVGIPDDMSLIEAGCQFCGACVEVCPTGALRDKDKLIAGRKKREALQPCIYNCPAHINVPLYVRLVKEGRYSESVAVIRDKVPFPETLGYICNHICETECRRGIVNEPVSIRDIKRFAVENDREEIWRQQIGQQELTDKKVAVMGSGPAGLTAAFYLARFGHEVTVLESEPLLGGLARYGIPTYRLPREVLDREIAEIEKLGVTFKTNTRVDSPSDLMINRGYDAVLVAVGLGKGKSLPIPGIDLEGVMIGLEFLKKVHSKEKVNLGETVVIIGGGNVAFDCARVACRLGASEVHLTCLEPADRMLADQEEIEQGVDEGILIHPSRTFSRIIGENGKAIGVSCLDIDTFEFNDAGTLIIETVDNSATILHADTIIVAIGQDPNIPDDFKLTRNGKGLIAVDPHTSETSATGIYAVGDVVSGDGSVIAAIASGKNGAVAVDKYLGGDGDLRETFSLTIDVSDTWADPPPDFAAQKRVNPSPTSARERLTSFQPAQKSLDQDAASRESKRCLRCDARLKITPVKFWGEYL